MYCRAAASTWKSSTKAEPMGIDKLEAITKLEGVAAKLIDYISLSMVALAAVDIITPVAILLTLVWLFFRAANEILKFVQRYKTGTKGRRHDD